MSPSAKTLAELALKIWGVTLLVSALASLPVGLLITAVSPGSDPQAALIRASQIGSIVNIAIRAVVGTAVIVWADRITDLIESDTTPIRIDTNTTELQVLGFALVGVFVLVEGLRDVASTAYVLFTKPAFDETEAMSYLWARQDQAIVSAVVEIIAGTLLVFGRNTVVHGWSRLRGDSVSGDSDDAEDDAG